MARKNNIKNTEKEQTLQTERKKIDMRLVWFLFFVLKNKNKEMTFDSLCFFILKNTKSTFLR